MGLVQIEYTLEYEATVADGRWIKGTMSLQAPTVDAAKVKATNAIRARFRQYGLKIKLKVLSEKDVIS